MVTGDPIPDFRVSVRRQIDALRARRQRKRREVGFIFPRHLYPLLPEMRQAAQSIGIENLMRWNECEEHLLHALANRAVEPMRLDIGQLEFIRAIRNSCLNKMFPDEAELMREWDTVVELCGSDLKEARRCVAVTCPRRSGKTVSLSIGIAIALLSQRGNVCSFNLTAKQSRMVMKQVCDYLEAIVKDPKFGWIMESKNQNGHLEIRPRWFPDGHCNMLDAYAGASRSSDTNIALSRYTHSPFLFLTSLF